MLIKCFAVCMLTLIHQTAWINQETQQWLACAAPGTAGTRAMNHVIWSGLWKELCVCVCLSDRQREQSGGTKSYSSSLPMHLPSKTHSGFMGYQCYWSLIWIHCLSIFTLTCDVTMFNINCRLLRMWSFWREAMGRGQWKRIVSLQWFVWFSFCHCPQKKGSVNWTWIDFRIVIWYIPPQKIESVSPPSIFVESQIVQDVKSYM